MGIFLFLLYLFIYFFPLIHALLPFNVILFVISSATPAVVPLSFLVGSYPRSSWLETISNHPGLPMNSWYPLNSPYDYPLLHHFCSSVHFFHRNSVLATMTALGEIPIISTLMLCIALERHNILYGMKSYLWEVLRSVDKSVGEKTDRVLNWTIKSFMKSWSFSFGLCRIREVTLKLIKMRTQINPWLPYVEIGSTCLFWYSHTRSSFHHILIESKVFLVGRTWKKFSTFTLLPLWTLLLYIFLKSFWSDFKFSLFIFSAFLLYFNLQYKS